MYSKDQRLGRLLEITRELELRKALYEEYDTIVLQLAAEGFTNTTIGDLVLELCDNFSESNTGWTSAAVKRYDLRVETMEKRAKRLARAEKKASNE